MSKNKMSGGKQAPAQRHAEGQHGAKTTDFLRQQHSAQSTGSADGSGLTHSHTADTPPARAERRASAKRKG